MSKSSEVQTQESLPEWKKICLEEIAEINPRYNNKLISDNTEVPFIPMKCVQEQTGFILPFLSVAEKYSKRS